MDEASQAGPREGTHQGVSSTSGSGEYGLVEVLQEADGVTSGDGREVSQEGVEGFAVEDVIYQSADGDSGTAEDGGAAEDVRVYGDW